eukprot:286066-Pyramimonas_sp.AAC.1
MQWPSTSPATVLEWRAEASWMLVGISWLASWGPLGGFFEAFGSSWVPLRGLARSLGGLLGASWGSFRAS